jgi:hypothetical protein
MMFGFYTSIDPKEDLLKKKELANARAEK